MKNVIDYAREKQVESKIIVGGAVVTKDVAPNTIVGGNPAKFIKKVDPEQAKELNQGIASHYIMYADWYR